MLHSGLWQAEQGPRIRVEAGYQDVLDPDTFVRLVVPVARQWGIWRTVLVWYMRDGHRKAVFERLDARKIEEDPASVLLDIRNSMIRSALKSGTTHELPKQFFTTELVGTDGRPLFNVPKKPGEGT